MKKPQLRRPDLSRLRRLGSLRRTAVVVPVAVAAVALGGGAVAYAVTSGDDELSGTTLEQARKRYQDAIIHEELEVMFHMYNLNPEDPIVRLVTRVMGEMGLTPDIRPSGGGTDANAMRLHGIDCVVVGMSTNEMHTIKEYVVVPDLVDTARFCERVITVKV